MAKATLLLSNGTKVAIEGTSDEVAILLEKFSQPTRKARTDSGKGGKKKPDKRRPKATTPRRKGPQQFIADLVQEDFFKAKRTIGDIQKKLEEKGHIYAQESLSTPLLRLIRKHTLRRLKEKKVWVYIH
jgi:hypothetical protein